MYQLHDQPHSGVYIRFYCVSLLSSSSTFWFSPPIRVDKMSKNIFGWSERRLFGYRWRETHSRLMVRYLVFVLFLLTGCIPRSVCHSRWWLTYTYELFWLGLVFMSLENACCMSLHPFYQHLFQVATVVCRYINELSWLQFASSSNILVTLRQQDY